MKPKTLILLAVAIGCGLIAAFLANQATTREPQKVSVVVAKTEVRAGIFINDKNRDTLFETKELPQDALPPNAVLAQEIAKLNKKLIARTIDQGAPVNLLRDIADSTGLATALPPGYRAATVRVTVDSAGAGFILPGSRVDLVCLMQDPKNQRMTQAKIFLQNVQVLAVNAEDSKPQDAKVVAQPAMVTLALSPGDAERAIRVSKDGVPHMILRRNDDAAIIKTDGAWTAFGKEGDGEPAETKKVLVARKAIREGTTIDNVDEFFETTALPPGALSADAISDPKDVSGQKVKFMGARTPMTREYLLDAKGPSGRPPEPRKMHVMTIYQGTNEVRKEFMPRSESAVTSDGTPNGPDGGNEGK